LARKRSFDEPLPAQRLDKKRMGEFAKPGKRHCTQAKARGRRAAEAPMLTAERVPHQDPQAFFSTVTSSSLSLARAARNSTARSNICNSSPLIPPSRIAGRGIAHSSLRMNPSIEVRLLIAKEPLVAFDRVNKPCEEINGGGAVAINSALPLYLEAHRRGRRTATVTTTNAQ
jgi:hypothetical protein